MLVVKQGIYEIRNIENGAVYVGQSVDTERRMAGHHLALIGDRHSNRYLQEDWNAYGEEAFTFQHVETVYREALLLPKEKERIDGYVETEVKLYNVSGVKRGKKWQGLKKSILFNPFQNYQKKPLVLQYLTFKDKPALSTKVVSIVEEPKKKRKDNKPKKRKVWKPRARTPVIPVKKAK